MILDSSLIAPLRALPSCPATPLLYDVLERVQAPNADPRAIATLIERDPELAERVTEAIARQTGRKVPDVFQGVRLCGLKALQCHLAELATPHELESGLSQVLKGDLLAHSQQVAWCSYLLALELDYRHPSEAYAAGLLHDLGLALLQEFPRPELTAVLALSEAEPASTPEDLALGASHAHVGARLLERWQQPPSIVKAVAYHHAPDRAPGAQRLTRIVHLAELAINASYSESEDTGLDQALKSLRLAPEKAKELAGRAIAHARRLQRSDQ